MKARAKRERIERGEEYIKLTLEEALPNATIDQKEVVKETSEVQIPGVNLMFGRHVKPYTSWDVIYSG